MLESADKYVVQYLAGLSGTVLSWFLNQHENFPKVNIFYGDDNDVSLASYATSWVLDDYALADDGIRSQNIDDVIAQIQSQLIDINALHKIEQFSKFALKTFPHDIINLDDRIVAEAMVKKVTDAGFKKWIYPFIYPDSGNHEVKESIIHRRWNSLVNRGQSADYELASEKMYECSTLETEANPFFIDMIEKYNISVHRIDISLLIAGDQTEYERLLKFIDSPPIDDWHNKLSEWTPWVGYRYVKV